MKQGTRQQQKEQTRERLLEAAYTVFARQGMLQSRMEDIAREAGVSHGTVFLHFHSQEELLEAVVSRYGGLIAARTHALLESGAGLRGVLTAYLQGVQAYETFYTRLLLEARLLPQGVRDSFLMIQSVLSHHFSAALEREGIAKRLNLEAHLLYCMWVGLVHHYLQNSDLYGGEGKIIARHGETLMSAYLTLINNTSLPEHKEETT